MSRRGNGREAAAWVPLRDLDPHLADAVLDLLADAGIAAYAAPVSDHRALMELPARVVDRPLDRVYVDREAAGQAGLVVDAALRSWQEPAVPDSLADTAVERPGEPAGWSDDRSERGSPERPGSTSAGPGETSTGASTADTGTGAGGATGRRGTTGDGDAVDEETWRALVEAFAGPSAVRPGHPDAAPQPEEPPTPPAGEGGRLLRRASDRLPGDVDRPAPTGDDPADRGAEPAPRDPALEDHFVPPPPPPLPRLEPVTRAAWAAVLGGPLILVIAALLGWPLGGWTGLLAVAAFVGGFVTLVVRMGDRPSGPGGDDGAVV